MNVLISPEASADLTDIGNYIASDDLSSAHKFVDAIILSCLGLSQNPERHRIVRVVRSRNVRLMPFRDYVVLYEAGQANVNILRIFHSSRDYIRVLDDVV